MNTILTNAIIYTVAEKEWEYKPANSVAYDDKGVIIAVGDMRNFTEDILEGSEIIDMQGKVILPGFIDSHVHAPGTAFMDMYELNLEDAHTKAETVEAIRSFVESHSGFDMYFGGGFDMSMLDENGNPPCAAWLDEICKDKPITLKSSDMHSRWLNTKSMQASGIDRDTTIEGFGHIHRFSNGEPTGLFTDCKVLPIMEPEYNEDQQLAAVSEFMKRMNAWGYTSIMSIAPIMLFEPERYMDLEKEDLLTLRINCAQMILPLEVDQCIHNLCRLREAFQHSDVRITTGKFLVDGVLEGKTALLKEPYAETAGMGPEYFGDINWGKEELKNAIRQVNKAGFQTHMHCIGDAATSQTVDAVEYSQKENNNDQLRNVITHLQIVDPDDIRRMSEEKIIAAIQPFWHFKEPGWFENIDTAMLGEKRAENQYPARSLVDAGIIITASGDYPVSPINDPFHGIQAGVTRNIYNDDYDVIIDDPDDKRFLLNAPERLSVAELIEAYTINGAYQLFREDEIGSLEQGKKADMIVIDQDILHCDLLRIHDTKVLATVFNGRVVHGLL